MKGEIVKKRIVKWTEEKYRIPNARKNWKKLADLYDLYLQKKEKLNLINLFSKYRIIIIFEYINAKNEIIVLKYYLNKWKNKIKEIKERDLKLEKLINKIDTKLKIKINSNFFGKLKDISRQNYLIKIFYKILINYIIKKT